LTASATASKPGAGEQIDRTTCELEIQNGSVEGTSHFGKSAEDPVDSTEPLRSALVWDFSGNVVNQIDEQLRYLQHR
jgi:hypothetical protein